MRSASCTRSCRPRRSTPRSTRSSPRSSPTDRPPCAPARSSCRTSPAAPWTRRCAPRPRAASPTSAPAPKAGTACRASCRSASRRGWPESVPLSARDAMTLDTAHLLAIAAMLGWASGLRLYLVVLLTGLAGALGWVELPPGLQVLQQPLVLAVSGLLTLVEFVADKVPVV